MMMRWNCQEGTFETRLKSQPGDEDCITNFVYFPFVEDHIAIDAALNDACKKIGQWFAYSHILQDGRNG